MVPEQANCGDSECLAARFEERDFSNRDRLQNYICGPLSAQRGHRNWSHSALQRRAITWTALQAVKRSAELAMMDSVKHKRETDRDEEEQTAFLPQSRPQHMDVDVESIPTRSRRAVAYTYARIAVEVLMALAIVALLLKPATPRKTWQKAVPECRSCRMLEGTRQ
jgi:hypothetical protein